MISTFIRAMEKGHIPDSAVRFGIRKLCKQRLDEVRVSSLEEREAEARRYIAELKAGPLAVFTTKANEQHYELPPEFFHTVLGRNLKYSSCYYGPGTTTLDEAEELALDISMKRAELKDGMRILELGCGWGSLTLAMAKRFPNSKVVAVSNSAPQKAFIDAEAKKRGLANVLVLTRDVSQLESLAVEFENFDRVVSVEMFEHFKNYELLLKKIADVLVPGGKLFVHIFTNRDYAYPYVAEGDDNWMARYFFTGGQMPSHHLLHSFQRDLVLEESWAWDGTHYARTCNHWLENMDRHKEKVQKIFAETYGAESVEWFNRWRVFFMACAEMFDFEGGTQWGVSHYRFSKR
jgi:cyclopropane-fatty-acyl-phospholipid synthase